MSAQVHAVITPERSFAASERQPSAGTFAPTKLVDRSEWLDALRGFALLGILVYNMMTFSGYVFRQVMPPVEHAWSALDPALDYLVHALVEGKFYSLFSFLFGLGFALQMRRAEALGGAAVSALRRRLAWLLVFGLAHALLIWFGDILTVYAVFGFVLLLWFRRMSQRALLAWALSFLAMPVLVYLVFLAFHMSDPLGGPATPGATGESLLGKAVRAMATGSYVDVLQTNALFYPGGWLRRAVRLMLPRIFGMFLLGMWVCRIGLPVLRDAQRPMLHRWLLWGVLLGLPLNAAYAALGSGGALLPASTTGLLVIVSASLGIPLLCLAYVAAFALFWRRSRPDNLLVTAGRTALSQYLGQSIVCVTLFYGIGFGLFGQLSYGVALAIALAVYAVLAWLSRLWLRSHAQGPMEALWRRLSYSSAAPSEQRASR
jgi:uncharacterized protein